jgi:transposase InsO family protein
MHLSQHKNATTTPLIRRQLQERRGEPVADLAAEYRLSATTVRRWQGRSSTTDLTSARHNQRYSFTPQQEAIIVLLRTTLLLTLDDLFVMVREHIKPDCGRQALFRLLKRNGINQLRDLLPDDESEERETKTFKSYEPGYIHIDIKELPRMPDEEKHSYLFVAIDRATRAVHYKVTPNKKAQTAADFLKEVREKFPFIITIVLTDNGKEFTDRFTPAGERDPTGRHVFDQACAENLEQPIEHRLTKPRTPQTNGMVERHNGRIATILKTTRFSSIGELTATLMHYMNAYNTCYHQRCLNHKTPLQAIQEYCDKHNLAYPDN